MKIVAIIIMLMKDIFIWINLVIMLILLFNVLIKKNYYYLNFKSIESSKINTNINYTASIQSIGFSINGDLDLSITNSSIQFKITDTDVTGIIKFNYYNLLSKYSEIFF